jgi:hypothetical protein
VVAVALVVVLLLVTAAGFAYFSQQTGNSSSPGQTGNSGALASPTATLESVQSTPTATSVAPTPTSVAPTPTPCLTQSCLFRQFSFNLPADGRSNNNGYIGPFCCTGSTATVLNLNGDPVGYIYFFSWNGQAYNYGNTSIAPDLKILVSGLSNFSDTNSAQVQSSVDIQASEMQVGASRSTTAGSLAFTVTITNFTAVTYNGQPYYDMGTITVRVDVSLAS